MSQRAVAHDLGGTTIQTPVALFTYNRPDHTNRALEALSRCRRTADCDFFFFSDGPKNQAAQVAVEETRIVLRTWAQTLKAEVIERTQNLGLARSIHAGVTDLTRRYGRIVVVEDDLVVSPDFLHFMLESLDRYADEDAVFQVGGFALSPPDRGEFDAFILPVTTTWGWGTWQRAWAHFSWQPEELEATRQDADWRKLFDINGAGAFSSMLDDRLTGKNDSWGILWWYAVSRRRGLVVYPAVNLVWNGGFDGSGIHSGADDFLRQGDAYTLNGARMPDRLRFPTTLAADPQDMKLLEAFLRRLGGGAQVVAARMPRRGFKMVMQSLAKRLQHALS
jgi:hypothetical protein